MKRFTLSILFFGILSTVFAQQDSLLIRLSFEEKLDGIFLNVNIKNIGRDSMQVYSRLVLGSESDPYVNVYYDLEWKNEKNLFVKKDPMLLNNIGLLYDKQIESFAYSSVIVPRGDSFL